MIKVGKILKILRTYSNLTQEEMAEVIGISRSYLSILEDNKKLPSLEILQQFGIAFGIPTALFLVNEDREDLDPICQNELQDLFEKAVIAKMVSDELKIPATKS